MYVFGTINRTTHRLEKTNYNNIYSDDKPSPREKIIHFRPCQEERNSYNLENVMLGLTRHPTLISLYISVPNQM